MRDNEAKNERKAKKSKKMVFRAIMELFLTNIYYFYQQIEPSIPNISSNSQKQTLS